jgi:hypothetical protein
MNVFDMLKALLATLATVASVHAAVEDLPPGVPKAISPDGSVDIPLMFTTKAYEDEAFRLLVREASRVAEELKLPEKIPIREVNITDRFISPFGYSRTRGRIGRVTTSKYTYAVVQSNKFSDLTIVAYSKTCSELTERGRWPIARLDTKTAYALATQWLAALSMDVSSMNHNCEAHVALSPFWNGLAKLGQKPQGSFVPIYFVWWSSPQNRLEGGGSVAYVELFLPERMLLQLSVQDQRYIARKALTFTNLGALFPGTGTIFTNHPATPILGRPPDSG